MKKIILQLSVIALIASCKTSTPTADIKPASNASSNGSLSTVDIDFMSKSIKANEDFFMFANEEWIKANPVPPSESRWGSFNELDKSNKEKLVQILETCKNSKNEKGSDEQLLGAYYSSYMNFDLRDKKGFSPLQEDLNKIASIKSKSEIVSIVAQQHMEGINSLFSFGVGQDLKNVEMNISYMSQGGIGLPNKDYYFSENKKELRYAYQKYIGEMLQMIGKGQIEAEQAADRIVTFEATLAEKMLLPAEMRIPERTYNKLSLEEASTYFGKFDFQSYLDQIKSHSFDSLIVSNIDFVKTIYYAMDEVDLTTWKDYLSWKLINHYAGQLSREFVEKKFEFYGKKLSGKTEMKPDNERVIDELTSIEISEVLGKAFVAKYYSEKAQNRVNEMVDNLLIVFRERINNLEWMSDETKKEALNKLNSIGRKLGFPSKWEDFTSLDLSSDDYLNNFKALSKYSHFKNMDELTKPVDKDKWGMPAHMVNAYYHPLLNEIAFPAGIMQPPFFDENAEDAVNYGRIGMVIGHEFTHGFDDMGSKFAADGTFKNWWSESDRKLFEEKTTILGQTYSAFCPIEDHCVNPDLTMGENIADLGGLTLAYYAYKRTDEFKKNEIREGFTPSQRFFISYAQLWKINYTEEEMKNRIANDPHSPGMYRVNGPLKNCPEFFEAFGIKEGDAMRNPNGKVAKIW
ncbi:MAG: M13 family peptidase [Bacteroidetes bacterium]|nr:MAG: M13 family peptidase [Bacteroidota bacterium]